MQADSWAFFTPGVDEDALELFKRAEGFWTIRITKAPALASKAQLDDWQSKTSYGRPYGAWNLLITKVVGQDSLKQDPGTLCSLSLNAGIVLNRHTLLSFGLHRRVERNLTIFADH